MCRKTKRFNYLCLSRQSSRYIRNKRTKMAENRYAYYFKFAIESGLYFEPANSEFGCPCAYIRRNSARPVRI